jgi:DNA-binding NtrC family response regulator
LNPSSGPPPEILRALRDAVAAAASGEEREAPLRALGLSGLSIVDGEGRDVVRLGEPFGSGGEVLRRALDAGSARFELALAPPVGDEVSVPIALVLETLLYRADGLGPPSDFAEGWRQVGVVTADPSMREPYRRLARFAPQSVTVLVLGESGSGKEAVARAVHTLSARAVGPFVSVNVPAIPAALLESELFGHARGAFTGAERDRRGLIEEATGGTIFFDEIGDLNSALQAKLLRALQEREIRRVGENRSRAVDVRVVSATSRDLAKEVEAGRFREDLYYRLHVITVQLPALRERRDDIPLLVQHFLEKYGEENNKTSLEITPDALDLLLDYDWPGNVRELENVIERAVVLSTGPRLDADLVPEHVRSSRRFQMPQFVVPPEGISFRDVITDFEKRLIESTLEAAGGVQKRAAELLHIKPTTLNEMIKRHEIRPRRKRASLGSVERAADGDAVEAENFPGSHAAAADER